MAMRNHSSRYSKRYKRTHYWNKVQRKPVGPYGGLGVSQPNGLYVKLTNKFDIGLTTDNVNFDSIHAVSDFVFMNWQPDGVANVPIFVDQLSSTIFASTPAANDTMYRATHELQAIPIGWSSKINPYTRYQVKGMKVEWTINPRMSAQWVNNATTGTTADPKGDYDIIRVGMAMDPALSNQNWYTAALAPGAPTTPDQSTWKIYDQKVFKELTNPVHAKKTVLKKYFDFAKYFRQPPSAYEASAFNDAGQYSANFAYAQTAGGNTGLPASATQPTSKAYLHFMVAGIGNYVNGGALSDNSIAFSGTIKTTYYVWLHQADTRAGWYFGRNDGT